MGEVRIGGLFAIEFTGRPDQADAGQEGDVNGEIASQVAVVRAPQGEQLAAFILDGAGKRRQAPGFEPGTPDEAALRLRGESEVVQVLWHLSLPAIARPGDT